MSEIVYRAGEVWLCRTQLDGFQPNEILEISGSFVRYKTASGFKRWVSANDWHTNAQTKLGVVRRFLGIRIGITK